MLMETSPETGASSAGNHLAAVERRPRPGPVGAEGLVEGAKGDEAPGVSELGPGWRVLSRLGLPPWDRTV